MKAFQYSCDRIKAMALVNESLYKSKDYIRIDMGPNISTLAMQLEKLHSTNLTIRVVSCVEIVNLDVGVAVPIELSLSFWLSSKSACELRVADCGKGISACDEEPRIDS